MSESSVSEVAPASPLVLSNRLRYPGHPISQRAMTRTDLAQKTFYADELAKRYSFPILGTNSPIPTVAILELGGGYYPADIVAYCKARNFTNVPTIENLNVGSSNRPGNDADGEVALDMQNIIGAMGGRVNLQMVWCPNTDAGFAAGVRAVTQNGKAVVGSISWGAMESQWTSQARSVMDAAFQAAMIAGIPWFCASGDNGSTDGGSGNNVDYPASSPYAVGCGGTTITANGEIAWSYGGGGLSAVYPKPAFQSVVFGGTKRCVPDVALNADPNSGYITIINGQWQPIGGTSAVSPMYAAAVALIVSLTGKRIVNFNQIVYALNNFADIIGGSNGAYKAAIGADLCTGIGCIGKVAFDSIVGATTPPPTVQTPVISSSTTALGQVGVPFNYQIVASNNPTSYSVSGLPSGLSVNNATGLISGVPLLSGSYSIGLTATNSAGVGFMNVSLTVINAPTPPTNGPLDHVQGRDAKENLLWSAPVAAPVL